MSADMPLISRLHINFRTDAPGMTGIWGETITLAVTTNGIKMEELPEEDETCFTCSSSIRSWLDTLLVGKPWTTLTYSWDILPSGKTDLDDSIEREKIELNYQEAVKMCILEYKQEVEAYEALGSDIEIDEPCLTPNGMTAWTIGTFLQPLYLQMIDSVGQLRRQKEVEGKECPIMMVPLTRVTGRQFQKCQHWVHVEALQNMMKHENTVKCPLCRAEHARCDIK